jgi:hypothetical protein
MARKKKERKPYLEVCEQRCDQCLFSKDRIVSGERAAELIKGCNKSGRFFVCHKGSINGNDDLCCRGFYDLQSIPLTQIAGRLDLVRFVPVPTTGVKT